MEQHIYKLWMAKTMFPGFQVSFAYLFLFDVAVRTFTTRNTSRLGERGGDRTQTFIYNVSQLLLSLGKDYKVIRIFVVFALRV